MVGMVNTILLDSPKEFANHLRLCVSSNLLLFGPIQIDVLHSLTGGTILSSAYGIPMNDPHDPYLELSERVVHAASEVSVPLGKYLVDLFPILKHVPKWFPGAEFKRKAAYERGFVERMINQPFEFVKRNMVSTPDLHKTFSSPQTYVGQRYSKVFHCFSSTTADARRWKLVRRGGYSIERCFGEHLCR